MIFYFGLYSMNPSTRYCRPFGVQAVRCRDLLVENSVVKEEFHALQTDALGRAGQDRNDHTDPGADHLILAPHLPVVDAVGIEVVALVEADHDAAGRSTRNTAPDHNDHLGGFARTAIHRYDPASACRTGRSRCHAASGKEYRGRSQPKNRFHNCCCLRI